VDPHVESLVYRLKTSEAVAFVDPPPLDYEDDAFTGRLESGRLTMTMKEHHASAESARKRVSAFLRAWELDLALRQRRPEISFEYDTATVIDRNPPPPGSRVIEVAGTAIGIASVAARLTVGRRQYPVPPSNFAASPDVETLWGRYAGYLDGREPISSMANFCLSLVEQKGSGRKGAAKMLGIQFAILHTLGGLTATKGDEQTARKVPRMGFTPYSAKEVEWIEAAVCSIIRRLGEVAAGSNLHPTLTMADLPALKI
jgi:hypothetical protein